VWSATEPEIEPVAITATASRAGRSPISRQPTPDHDRGKHHGTGAEAVDGTPCEPGAQKGGDEGEVDEVGEGGRQVEGCRGQPVGEEVEDRNVHEQDPQPGHDQPGRRTPSLPGADHRRTSSLRRSPSKPVKSEAEDAEGEQAAERERGSPTEPEGGVAGQSAEQPADRGASDQRARHPPAARGGMIAGDVGEPAGDEQADADPLAGPGEQKHREERAEGGERARDHDQPHRAPQRSARVALRQQPGESKAEQRRGHRQPGHRRVGMEVPVK
jgi:hypothetical protein